MYINVIYKMYAIYILFLSKNKNLYYFFQCGNDNDKITFKHLSEYF